MPGQEVAPGLVYRRFRWRETRIHALRADLKVRTLRAIPSASEFPLVRYSGSRPPELAHAAGALASVGGGFAMVSSHQTGVTGQPAHVLMVDREVWTTGLGHGGHAYTGGERIATVKRGDVQVRLWFPVTPGWGAYVVPVNEINRGHVGNVMFTPRGGTNEAPNGERHTTRFGWAGPWEEVGMLMRRPIAVREGPLVLESDEPLKVAPGARGYWTQRAAAFPVRDMLGGMTELVRDGVNHVPALDLFGGASQGPDNWYIRKNPRTALATTADGRHALVVVAEGRVEGSRGLRLKEFATLLLSLGAHQATNMDGGGSSHMWIKDRGLVADSCYGDGTLRGIRPNVYATAIF
jgi:hypothetical protein